MTGPVVSWLPAMVRYRLCIAYDGTDFHGWQRQRLPTPTSPDSPSSPFPSISSVTPVPQDSSLPSESLTAPEVIEASPGAGFVTGAEGVRTVQAVVERAVRQAVRAPITLIGASRTDAGVHALAQTAAFSISEEDRQGGGAPDERLAQAINARLPEDVLVRSCARAREDFQPITDCLAKGYRYRLHVSPERPLWDRRFVHHFWRPLDEGAMREAARLLVGEHDFAAFAAARHGRLSTVRTVLSCEVTRPAPQRIDFNVSGTGFLWNMVRIIAGTLVEVGLGRMTGENIRRALATGDRRLTGPTMPAKGLCLMWGRYPDDPPGDIGDGPAPPFIMTEASGERG